MCHWLSQCHPPQACHWLASATQPHRRSAAKLSGPSARNSKSAQPMPVQQSNQQSELIVRGQYTPDSGVSTPQVFQRPMWGGTRPTATTSAATPDNTSAPTQYPSTQPSQANAYQGGSAAANPIHSTAIYPTAIRSTAIHPTGICSTDISATGQHASPAGQPYAAAIARRSTKWLSIFSVI